MKDYSNFPGGGGLDKSLLQAFTLAGGITPQSTFTNSCKYGFTLAEVLITLGIIGIVAALTLPAMIAKYQQVVLKNQFKKTDAILSEAHKHAKYEFGAEPLCFYKISGWTKHHCAEWSAKGDCTKYVLDSDGVSPLPPNAGGYFTDCAKVSDLFLNNFKIIKSCQDKAYEKGCIPKYAGIDTIYKSSNPDASDLDINKATNGLAGWRQDNILNRNQAIVLSDGQILLSYSKNFSISVFAVDINGKKGPNKWGYDVFGFESRGEYGSIPSRIECYSGAGAGVEKGGLGCRSMIRQ